MNTRIVISTFVLTLAAFTGAQAQTELPNQWVEQQMRAAAQTYAAQAAADASFKTAAVTVQARAPVDAGEIKADGEKTTSSK